MKLQFRRHMVVTLLSRYAMYSYTGSLGPTGQVRLASYRDGPDDAAATLNHIETAQKQLRAYISGLGPAGSVSKGLPMLASGLIPFEESERLHRVVAVLQVLIDADRPLIGRAKNFVLNILGAIGGGPSAISRILDQIADGIKSAIIVRAFTEAYMIDAINYWEDLDNRAVTLEDWYYWDKKLDRACIVLAAHADASDHHCFAGKKAPEPASISPPQT